MVAYHSLQMDSILTLAKVVQKIRQHEEIEKQQPTVDNTAVTTKRKVNLDMVKGIKRFHRE